MTRKRRRGTRRRLIRAGLRDTLVLLREFSSALVLFAGTLLFGAIFYQTLAGQTGAAPSSYGETLYLILTMIFLQAGGAFPEPWYLQLFFFVMPVVGLAILGRGAADFAVLLFNRQARGEAWQVAIASTYSEHIVLIGVGHLGFRVARQLHNMGASVVAIERDPDAGLIGAVEEMGFPIIAGDATRAEVLRKSGVDRAAAVVLCTSDDVVNLKIALKVHEMNPETRIVVRIFDDEFARGVQQQFAIDQAISGSALAAPAFAAAAISADMLPPVTIAGRTLSMTRFSVRPRSKLAGMTIGELEDGFDASVVLHDRNGTRDLHPADDVVLDADDDIAIFAERDALDNIARANQSA
ncbi:MAG: potassium channel family protein [Anaerolineales bacterium]